MNPETDNRALVPVEYVGKKAEKTDNVAGTGLVWTPGQIHYVPPLMAQKLAKHPDVWRIAEDAAVDDDPARIGLVVTQTDAGLQSTVVDEKKPEVTPQTFDLPNLQGMTRSDIAAYAAANFNTNIPANGKKEDMITQIVSLANSRAAGEIQ
ncbi:hypothetical protein RE432_14850 [Pusillimonas sp. SM2304]|uniref:hypothetical protein n=1 Tax=Pusillimonas sp. SM2304 TaxID=3073241 RepID=UPI00287510C3|nr:hypothetical protein [Pusillimonas sp. SM2304]MDS1141718.1 hypothetical protein [Pusillimonas sp. SM2304]